MGARRGQAHVTAGRLGTECPLGLTNHLAALLVAGDPRGAADRTLEFLLSLNRARAAVVFALDGDRLILFSGRSYSLEAVATAQAAWADHRAELIAGQV